MTISDTRASGKLDQPQWVTDMAPERLDDDTVETFARLRAEAPVAWVPALEAWFMSTWEHCHAIPSNPVDFAASVAPEHALLFGHPFILSAEGDPHADLRTGLGTSLRPREFKALLEDLVRPVARRYVEELRPRGTCDLMTEYFEPVSVLSVGAAMGFGGLEAATLQRWFHTLALATAHRVDDSGALIDPHAFDDADVVRAEIRAVLEERRRDEEHDPGSGSIANLFRAGRGEGEMREIDEILPSMMIIFLGGLQEPGHAGGSTLLGLLSRPEQLQEVRENPVLLGKAIAEGLRWMSPLYGSISWTPTHDLEVGGRAIAAGELIWTVYGSANHDEREFTDPRTFDLHRAPHPHLAFGTGRHSCLGSAFAPQVERIILEELLTGLPDLRLDLDRPPVPRGWMFHGAPHIHATWTP